jgi:dephospho-CoA kinase
MLKVGVTGGIGSGKSLICRIFSILGVPVYNADAEAGRIINEDREIIAKLQRIFGREIIREGKPDRKMLAGMVFDDPAALKQINEIVHPAVNADFRIWLTRHYHFPYIIKEAAILFETGTYRHLDTVILVTAPEELRVQRVMVRNGEDEVNIRKRMQNQWPDEKKSNLAGVVIENDNRKAVLPVILHLHSEFSSGYLHSGKKLNLKN